MEMKSNYNQQLLGSDTPQTRVKARCPVTSFADVHSSQELEGSGHSVISKAILEASPLFQSSSIYVTTQAQFDSLQNKPYIYIVS